MEIGTIFFLSVKIFNFLGVSFKKPLELSTRKGKLRKRFMESLFWIHVTIFLLVAISSARAYFDDSQIIETRIESIIGFVLILLIVSKSVSIWWNRILIGEFMEQLKKDFLEDHKSKNPRVQRELKLFGKIQ